MCLKRHRESGAEPPPDSAELVELETLYIFGLRANYMQTFRDLLQAEGMRVDRETVTLSVTWNFSRQKNLKLIRLARGVKYEHSDVRLVLPNPGDPDGSAVVEMDLYSRLQAVASSNITGGGNTQKPSVKLDPRHIALFDRTRIHDALLAHKRRMDWHNLAIRPETVDRLLENDAWYVLNAPPERLEVKQFQDVRRLEGIAIDLIAEYTGEFWRTRRRQWEHDRIEVVTLNKSDRNNIREYRLSMDAAQTRLIEDVRHLKQHIQAGHRYDLKLAVIMTRAHAYTPLLYSDRECEVSISPIALDVHEKTVVEGLAELAELGDLCLQGKELYLIRNLTRSRGVSFFDDYAYYPDFIVWLIDGESQHVIFLDPKGLVRYGMKERKKVKLHTAIKEIEKRVRSTDADLRLHAYVLSVTPPELIGDELRTRKEWEQQGVYFLNEPDCLTQLIGHALNA